MRKKFIALLLAIVLVLACSASALAFSDTGSHWAASAIAKWSEAGVVKGYADNTFKPDANITRAEFAAMLNRVLKYSGSGASFNDVKASDWFAADVLALAQAKVVNGYADGGFHPNAPITREEACAMLARALSLKEGGELKFSDAAQISAWAKEAVAALSAAKYIGGYPDNSFRPQGYITRAEVVTILNNASANEIIAAFLASLVKPEPTEPAKPSGSGASTGGSIRREKPSVDNIVSIQPYSELTYYAVAVTKIEITYKAKVNLSGVTADTYHLIDRGYLYPDFGQLPIADVQVKGNVVTLTIDRDTTANADNALIYAGADATGARTKDDIFGVHACFSWYRELDGDIVKAARAFQFRETELKLWHEGEDEADALCQAIDATGKYDTAASNKFAETDIEYFTGVTTASFEKGGKTHNYTKGGFMTLEQLGIQIPSSSGVVGDYVMAYVAFPDNYDPNKEYPIILSLPGNSAAMWDTMENGKMVATNPYGATFFNGSAINWYDKGADIIAVYVSHRYYSDLAPVVADVTDLSLPGYNYLKDDMAIVDYFVANYGAKANHVIITGDSRGTMAGSLLIKAYPGRISTFFCINGDWGRNTQYRAADYAAAASSGLSVWCMDGELDSDNIPVMAIAKPLYEKYFGAATAADKLRHSGIDAHYNYYWADTDHSVTKFLYWYLMDTIYYGPGHIEDGEIIYDSTNITSYELKGKKNADGTYVKAGYKYPVYTDTAMEWALSPDRELKQVAPSVNNIVSIQPYSELTYYATAVTKVDITYNWNVDLSGVTADTYHLIDRGYLYPDFGQLPIADVEVNGNVVTLTIDRDTTANADNALIYAGADATGARTKDDIFGVHACFSWYRELDGDIVKAARAFQFRETELKLWHEGEDEADALCQAIDATGKYDTDPANKFAETDIEYFTGVTTASFEKGGQTYNYTKGGFMTLEQLGIQIPSSSGNPGDYVMAYVAFPDGYDPNKEYPIILSLSGNNASMWDIMEDGKIIATNPYGPTFFNGSAINWYDKGADIIAVYVSHRYYSDYAPGVAVPTDLSLPGYNYVKDDMAIVDYFIAHYGAKANHVILTGDSRGTNAASDIIKAYPGRISTFLCINGLLGGWPFWGSTGYGETEMAQIASYGLSVWCIDGELDTSNIDTLAAARAAYAAAGFSQAEIADKLRHSDLATEYNYYWAETDHSATKFVYWYLLDSVFHGPGHIEDGAIVYDDTTAATYEALGKKNADGSYAKAGYTYTVYQDSVMDWALSPDRELK